MQIHPYLNFNGNAEEAFNFYKAIFGGDFLTIHRYKDTPEAQHLSKDEQEKIMNIALPVGDGNILMATDVLKSMGHSLSIGNNVHISVTTSSTVETEKIFRGLSDGGQITIPLDKMFWGDFFGMCTDKFGVHWMVSNQLENTGK